jgi:hypothetical protein
MLLARWVVLLLLLGVAVSFAFYIGTGQVRYKTWSLKILKWTLLSAFVFFAVLAVQRLA